MVRRVKRFGRHGIRIALCLILGMFTLNATTVAAESLKRLYHNEDCTNFFWCRSIPQGKAGELIDRYIDVMADAGVTVFLCNTNARRTNYESRVWESFWDGYDPAGPDDQPFLAPMRRNDVPAFRKGIGNMLAVHQQGVDYPARVVQRCRHRGISPWITLRMNDCHENDIPTHPFHGSFWKKNPQWARKNATGYFATCLDYAVPQVRDFYEALIVESLDRYDIDGLELDFMREPYVFSAGKEAEGTPILTAWIREIHKLIADVAAKRGHPILLGVRVPSRPETALAMGLDAATWAKEGLIDLVVATPRWATLEFDMPLERWRKVLKGSKAILAGGLEVLYRPCPGGAASVVSPELATGAAVSVLSRGAEAVYLFNYFQDSSWPPDVYRSTLKAMGSLDSLLKLPRRIGITYRDITAPGEQYQPPLPATGKEVAFSMRFGPIPDRHWIGEVLVELVPTRGLAAPMPLVLVDGKLSELRHHSATKEGPRLAVFSIPAESLVGTRTHQIKVVSKDPNPITLQRLEISLTPIVPGR